MMDENKSNQENEKTDTPQPQFESNAARRLRLMGVENNDKIHDASAEITKGNFFANLWYKHKWAIIITTFFVVLAIALICTFIFRDRPDMRISYNGPVNIGENEHIKLNKAFDDVVKDYDGDDEIEITFTTSLYRTAEEKKDADRKHHESRGEEFDETKPYSDDDLSEVSNSLRLSKYNFVLIDKELYDKTKNSFTTLYDILGEDAKEYEDITYGDCGIYLLKTKFAEAHYKNLSFLPSDTIIAICKPGLFDKNLDNEIETLKKILTYEQE